MSGTILLGYDVESASADSAGFLAGAGPLHDNYETPWTIYLTGQTAEQQAEAIRKVKDNSLLTIGQHTYSHVLLKSVYMMPGDGKPVHNQYPNCFVKGGDVEDIRAEIGQTQRLLADLLGLECRGLTGPWGYYRGLVDRPDLLEILQDNGIQWIRTDARDSRDCQPTPFTAQPHFYTDQGFPDILELGVQGYQDDFYWDRFDDRRHGDSYQDYLYAMLEEVAAKDWVWNICSHDHGTPTKEAFAQTKGAWLGDLIERAKKLGIRFLSPPELYREMREAKGEK